MSERPVEAPSPMLRAENNLHGLLTQQEGDEVRVRNLWNVNMKNAPTSFSYLKTVVLMLSWAETDLQTQPEVRFLSLLQFKY